MTVCIAAKSGTFIFGIADRMLTAGDIEYEPSMPKIIPLTNSIVAMTAGDASFQAEIILEIFKWISAKLQEEPKKWLVLQDVANKYAYFYSTAKLTRAENAILTPLGLNRETFITRQHEMSQDFLASVTKEMLNFDVPLVSAIIAGHDETGAHIYVVDSDSVSCRDTIGFASIGIGARHADSQFMLGRHSVASSLPETLVLTYTAKKRSEVSPGVGKEEDYFFIGDKGALNVDLNSSLKDKLRNEYGKLARREKSALGTAKKEVEKYVVGLSKESSAQAQKVAETASDGNVGAAPAKESTVREHPQ